MNEKFQILIVMAIVSCGIGGAFMHAAITDADWIFDSYKYKFWVKLIGRKNTRYVVGIIGFCICLIPLYLYIFK